MYTALKYLFYRIYIWQSEWFGKNNVPEFKAISAIVVLLGLNLYTLWILVRVSIEADKFTIFGLNRLYILTIMLVAYYFAYLVFIRKGKYLKIAKEFKGENKELRRKRSSWIFAYVLGTFFMSLIMLVLEKKLN